MAYSLSSSNVNSKVHTCSTECEQSYAQLKKLYDTQKEQLGDASIEIQACTQALKKVTALTAEEENSTSPHSRAACSARDAQGTPTQSAAHSQRTASVQGTAAYHRSKPKLKGILSKFSSLFQPVVQHHAFWVENQNLKKQKRRRKKHKKKVSSVKLGRNKDEGTLSEEHNVQEEDTAHPFFDDIVDKDAAVTPDLERKSDETEEVNIEEKEASNVKSGETEELDLETTQSTARQGTITPRTLNFEDEADQEYEAFLVPIQPHSQTANSRALEIQMMRRVVEKFKLMGCRREEERGLKDLKKTKPKTTLRKPTILAQERNQNDNFLKGQGSNILYRLKAYYTKVHLSNDEDSGNDHLPKADSRQDWWKPLPEEQRPATPEPTWTIPSSNVSDIENNWASTLVSTYETPVKNSLLAKTEDMMTFMKCKGSNPALSISKMKAASYPDFGLELLVPKQITILTDMILRRIEKMSEHICGFSVSSESKHTQDTGHLDHLPGLDKRILSTAVKQWTQKLVIRQHVEDFQLSIESYQTQLNLTKLGWDATGYEFKHDYTIIESP
ncbi:hypothetical protein Tco_1029584 [Tanacetum coccineum]|uniref:Uncharacterized protein n=1 Tax=Tanacetum coccineum TaxID=301880 RepID=A0ABQ5G5D9_9ASTR